MEILIPGLVLVGFMIWASTRIKRNAARAFEREEIETAEFSIIKPEGFLSVVDPEGGLLFSAYSREFGRGDAERMRQATAEIRRFPDANFDEMLERVKEDSSSVAAEQIGILAECKCATIAVERSEMDIAVETFYKIVAGNAAVFQLAVTVLPEFKEELSAKTDMLLDTFALK